MESWDKLKHRSPADLIHSYRLLAMGGCGRGKTNYMKQIFLATQCSARKFKKLYVITCDLDSREWDDCCPSQIFDKLPPIELFDSGEKTCVIIDDYEFEKCGKEEMRKDEHNLQTIWHRAAWNPNPNPSSLPRSQCTHAGLRHGSCPTSHDEISVGTPHDWMLKVSTTQGFFCVKVAGEWE